MRAERMVGNTRVSKVGEERRCEDRKGERISGGSREG